MTAGNQVPEGIVATIDDGRDVIHGQSVRPFAACLAFGLKVRAVFADTMRGVNHGLSLCWCDIIALGTANASTSSRTRFIDGCRVVCFLYLVAFFVIVGISGDLFQAMFSHIGA